MSFLNLLLMKCSIKITTETFNNVFIINCCITEFTLSTPQTNMLKMNLTVWDSILKYTLHLNHYN